MPGRPLLLLFAVLALTAGCGGGGTTTAGEAGARSVRHEAGTTSVPAQPRRIVALGEEFLLADLLDLGVRPVASTATLGDRFSGLAAGRTRGIEPLDLTVLDLERVAALRPDLLLVDGFVLGQAGFRRLSAVAPTVPIGAGDWRAALRLTARAVGRSERVDPLLAAYREAIAAGRAGLAGRRPRVSVATAYPGEVVAWVDGPAAVPAVLEELGATLVPDRADGVGRLREGRATIGLERLDLLGGDTLVLLQSGAVPGEDATLRALRRSPLYARLPAVRAGRELVLDRLGHPGAGGRTRLARELATAVAR